MTNLPLHDRFSQALLTLLEEAFEKPRGIFLDRNTSIFETLKTISAEKASRPLSADCACIAAHVEHMSFYMDVTLKFVRGEQQEVDWSDIWRNVTSVTAEEWQVSQQKLREKYDGIVQVIKTSPSWEGENFMEGAMGILAHNAYHLGEIRQALCTLKHDERNAT